MVRLITIYLVSALIIITGGNKIYAQLDGTGNAPDFILEDIGGTEHHLYEYLDSGKIVVLDFFAVWCGICQSNTPVLESIYEKYGPEGSGVIELLSMEADNSTTDQQVEDFASFYGSSNPHINQTGDVAADYNIKGYPFYYVVAPDRSYRVITGIEMNLEEKLSEAIESSPGLRTVENDIRIVDFSEPRGTYCSAGIWPELYLHNYGINTVTDVEIELFLDSRPYYTHRLRDTIVPYEYHKVFLPEIVGPANGWHEISFTVKSVNNLPDAESNNGDDKGYFLFLEESVKLEIRLKTDRYPKETSWQVLEDGKIAAERSDYLNASTEYTDTICLQEGHCYTLRIFDSFGDGLSEGGVQVLFMGNSIAGINFSEFNADSTELEFCLNEGSSGIFDFDFQNQNKLNIYPNPSSGEIYIDVPHGIGHTGDLKIVNYAGQVLYHSENYQLNTNKTLNLSAFPDGIVFLRLSIDNHFYTKRLIIRK